MSFHLPWIHPFFLWPTVHVLGPIVGLVLVDFDWETRSVDTAAKCTCPVTPLRAPYLPVTLPRRRKAPMEHLATSWGTEANNSFPGSHTCSRQGALYTRSTGTGAAPGIAVMLGTIVEHRMSVALGVAVALPGLPPDASGVVEIYLKLVELLDVSFGDG